jgi:uncharacterized protein YecE (DUF72 family)
VFSVKAPRYATIRKVLAEAAPAIGLFVKSGLVELRDRLGPLLWQFAPTKRYEHEDVEAFLRLLPKEIAGRRVRNVVEPRHESFVDPRFVELARQHGCAIVFTDSTEYPCFGDVTSDFVYARLVRSESAIPTGYAAPALDAWAKVASTFARGSEPKEFARVTSTKPPAGSRDVFIYFINGAKARAPAAAMELLSRLGKKTG